jgi:hypothetical protein
VPRQEVLFFTTKKLQIKQADLRNTFKKASKSVCTSTVVVFLDPSSPTPLTSSAMNTPQITEEDPDHHEPANLGDTQMEYFSA